MVSNTEATIGMHPLLPLPPILDSLHLTQALIPGGSELLPIMPFSGHGLCPCSSFIKTRQGSTKRCPSESPGCPTCFSLSQHLLIMRINYCSMTAALLA